MPRKNLSGKDHGDHWKGGRAKGRPEDAQEHTGGYDPYASYEEIKKYWDFSDEATPHLNGSKMVRDGYLMFRVVRDMVLNANKPMADTDAALADRDIFMSHYEAYLADFDVYTASFDAFLANTDDLTTCHKRLPACSGNIKSCLRILHSATDRLRECQKGIATFHRKLPTYKERAPFSGIKMSSYHRVASQIMVNVIFYHKRVTKCHPDFAVCRDEFISCRDKYMLYCNKLQLYGNELPPTANGSSGEQNEQKGEENV